MTDMEEVISSEDGSTQTATVSVMKRADAQKSTKQMAEAWLVEAEYYFGIQALLSVLEFRLEDKNNPHVEEVQKALAILKGASAQKESNAWRHVFMLGLTQTTKDRQEFKTLAFEKFAAEGSEIMQILDPNNKETEWTKRSRKQLRKLLRKAFGVPLPKKKKSLNESIGALDGHLGL
jgi:hypothetical protein